MKVIKIEIDEERMRSKEEGEQKKQESRKKVDIESRF